VVAILPTASCGLGLTRALTGAGRVNIGNSTRGPFVEAVCVFRIGMYIVLAIAQRIDHQLERRGGLATAWIVEMIPSKRWAAFFYFLAMIFSTNGFSFQHAAATMTGMSSAVLIPEIFRQNIKERYDFRPF